MIRWMDPVSGPLKTRSSFLWLRRPVMRSPSSGSMSMDPASPAVVQSVFGLSEAQ